MKFEFTPVETLIILQALGQMCLNSEVNEVDKCMAYKLRYNIRNDVKKQSSNGYVR